MEINKYIDYIQAPSDSFEEYLKKAKELNVRAIFANQFNLQFAREYLKDTDIIIAASCDFPFGKATLPGNLADVKALCEMGFKEIDYVLNQYAVENRNYDYIAKQMTEIAKVCRSYGVTDKCIVETGKLDGDKDALIKICQIANEAKPTFLKTTTGRSVRGVSLEDIQVMRANLDKDIKIKGAGGIKTYAFAKELIDAGANALGASAAIDIVEQSKNA